jgi:uncharacterized protein YqeY
MSDTTLSDKINNDIKEAMKKQDKPRLDAIRYLKAMFIENRTSGSPKPEMDILIAHTKKMRDSLAAFPEGNEQRVKGEVEVAILTEYLPAQLSEEKVREMVKSIVAKLEKPNMGMVMKELTPMIKGQFDGKLASQIVTDALKA